VGNFDGIHPGHAAVIAQARALAQQDAIACAVLSFAPHPRRVIDPHTPPFLLQRPRQKAAMLRSLGVDIWYVLSFNRHTMALAADDFMQRVLADMCGAKHVVTGNDFAFGHKRSGNVALLASSDPDKGFSAHAISSVATSGQRYGSSAIREAVTAGDMVRASRLLGRPYSIAGRVVHGDGRGNTIGFPTANIAHDPAQCMPAHGVYAVRLTVGKKEYAAVANCGTRPTFHGEGTRLEVHVLDASPDLYGQRAEVALLARIRGEQRFDGVEALQAQIINDCEAARAIHTQ
jgi:riboflavin kinase/FMN adenylyltransferase